MNINKIKTLILLIETGSYTEAANQLFMSQPTVSSHIKSLEEEFKVKLVKKRGKKYVPTTVGNVIYLYALEMIRLEKKMYEAARSQYSNEESLKICTTDKGTYILPEITKKFEKINPNIKLFFSVSNTISALETFKNNNIDCLIAPYCEEMKGIAQEKITLLGQDYLALAISSQNNLLTSENTDITNIFSQKLIIREEGSNTRQLTWQWLKDNQLKFNNIYEMSNSEIIIQSVRENVGVSILPKYRNNKIPHGIRFVNNLPGLPIKRYYVLITKNPKSEVVKDFTSLTKEVFSNYKFDGD